MRMKKKILIYAHYYVPDTASTGQILQDLAEGLRDVFDVTVICVVPSYGGVIAKEYKTKLFYKEELNGVHIARVRVPAFTKLNKRSRVRNILAYFIGAMLATFCVGKMDYVYSISQPPILGGLLGVWGKWVKRAKFIYNIQDFNPEQVQAVSYSKSKVVLGLMLAFDKFTCKTANQIIVVGRDMVDTLRARFAAKAAAPAPAKTYAAVGAPAELPSQPVEDASPIPGVARYCFINNWTDETKTYPLPFTHPKVAAFRQAHGLQGKFVIMYSGNMGLYYDLQNLIKVMQLFPQGTKTADGRELMFAFVGGGSMCQTLKDYVEANGMQNVVFAPYQAKEELVYSLNAADVHWCVNAKGIKGVSVPSKCYGIMAAAKPVLAVLEQGSECERIIAETGCGLCCEPADYAAVQQNIMAFLQGYTAVQLTAMGVRGRVYLEQHLTKTISVTQYIKTILAL